MLEAAHDTSEREDSARALARLQRLNAEYAQRVADWTATPKSSASDSLRRHGVVATFAIILLFAGLLVWAATTHIAGAVVANGTIVTERGDQKVQHPEGGVIHAVLSRNGDHVQAGQVLLQLDGTTIEANLAIVKGELREAYGERDRLLVETGVTTTLGAGAELGALGTPGEIKSLIERQKALMISRAAARQVQIDQLNAQVRQLEQQIAGYKAQLAATEKALSLSVDEDQSVGSLFQKGLSDAQRLNQVRRSRASLEGEQGSLQSSIDQAAAQIEEKRAAIAAVDTTFRTQALTDLQSIEQKIADLQQQRIAAEDRLARLDIRAPVAGVVQGLIATTSGVAGAGELIATIVPDATRLVVEARLGALDVDKVSPGQSVVLRFPSLDPRTTPEIEGSIETVTPDLVRDTATGQSYYGVRVTTSGTEAAKLPPGTKLMPGMPVEAFAQTGERSVLSILLQPLLEQMNHVFVDR